MKLSLVGCLAALVISLATVPAARTEIRISIATPLTGPRAWAGEETRAGAAAAVKDLNDHGGILGEALVTILVDDFCDPNQAVAAAKKARSRWRAVRGRSSVLRCRDSSFGDL